MTLSLHICSIIPVVIYIIIIFRLDKILGNSFGGFGGDMNYEFDL